MTVKICVYVDNCQSFEFDDDDIKTIDRALSMLNTPEADEILSIMRGN